MTRKRRKQPNHERRRTKPTTGYIKSTPKPQRTGGRHRYVPGEMGISEEFVSQVMAGSTAEQLPILGLPLWYLLAVEGAPANLCLDASLTLQAAFELFGIEAAPAPVELFAPDERGEPVAYGNDSPRFDNGNFIGHVGLWLPGVRRFIDPTVQQFPGLRSTNPSPVTLPTGDQDWPQLVGGMVGAICAQTRIMYRPLPLEALDEPLRQVQELMPGAHHRAGVNLAGNFLELVRADQDLRSKIDNGPYPQMTTLLNLLNGTELVVDDDENLRVVRPGQTKGQYLDELLSQTA